MRTHVKKNGGFTLVELIVVIAILAILGGVAVPAYSGYIAKANQQADMTLAADVEKALTLAYYSGLFGEDFAGGSVVLSTTGARVDSADAEISKVLAAAMENTFGAEWAGLKLKYDGWTNTQSTIKNTIAGSNFADGNNVNMELLGAVDNLTGQLGDVLSTLNLTDDFSGFNTFLTQNGIDASDSQLAANSAVLYLSQTSMDKTKREEAAKQLTQQIEPTLNPGTGKWEVNVYDFMTNMTVSNTCTEFEALAMVYAAMTGYCLQKGEDTYNEFISMDLLNKDTDGNPTVKDEGDVLRALEDAFEDIVITEYGTVDGDFYNYLDNHDLLTDINAYYGVIDGISENQDYLKENLNGNDNFYSSQESFLTAYWNATFENGDLCVLLYKDENGQWMADTRGMGQ